MLLNPASVVDCQVVTVDKHQQVSIDNFRENSRQVTHDYTISDQFYVEMTGIYRKLDYKKQGPYIVTDLFPNGTVQLQHGQVNE